MSLKDFAPCQLEKLSDISHDSIVRDEVSSLHPHFLFFNGHKLFSFHISCILVTSENSSLLLETTE